MNNYINAWKQLKKEMGMKSILDGLFASLVFSLFIVVPTVLIYLQIISMYYHLLLLWVILMIITFLGMAAIQLLLWKKALTLKKPDLSVDLKGLFIKQMLINSAFIILIGLLFIFIWIPSLQV